MTCGNYMVGSSKVAYFRAKCRILPQIQPESLQEAHFQSFLFFNKVIDSFMVIFKGRVGTKVKHLTGRNKLPFCCLVHIPNEILNFFL